MRMGRAALTPRQKFRAPAKNGRPRSFLASTSNIPA